MSPHPISRALLAALASAGLLAGYGVSGAAPVEATAGAVLVATPAAKAAEAPAAPTAETLRRFAQSRPEWLKRQAFRAPKPVARTARRSLDPNSVDPAHDPSGRLRAALQAVQAMSGVDDQHRTSASAQLQTQIGTAAITPARPTWVYRPRTDVSQNLTPPRSTNQFRLIGRNPALGSSTLTIEVPIVPIRVITHNGRVFDPAITHTAAGAVEPVLARLRRSPLFSDFSYYVNGKAMGHGQYLDSFVRAGLAEFTRPGGVAPNYHIVLQYRVEPPVEVRLSANEWVELKTPTTDRRYIRVLNDALLTAIAQQIPIRDRNWNREDLPIFITSQVISSEPSNISGTVPLAGELYTYIKVSGGDQTVGFASIVEGDEDAVGADMAEVSRLLLKAYFAGEFADVQPVYTCRVMDEDSLYDGYPYLYDEDGTRLTRFKVPSSTGAPFVLSNMPFVTWYDPTGPSTSLHGRYSFTGEFPIPCAPAK